MPGSGKGWYVGGTLGAGVPGMESNVFIPTVFYYGRVSPASPASPGSGESYTAILAGPFGSRAAAQAWATQYSGGSAPDGGVSTNSGNTQGALNSPNDVSQGNSQSNLTPGITNPLDFLGEVGDFAHRLTEANTWIRIGYVLAGVALIITGVAHLSGADNALMNAARKVPIIP